MNTSPPPHENSSTRSASSPSILSRLAAPFSGKNRSFADFDITLDEPLREYRAGDGVKGSIQLAVPKPLRITHLVLSLHGFVKVYKTAAAPGEGLPSEVKTPVPGRGKTGVEYLGNGLVSLFEDEVILCGNGKLNVGKYSFRFEARFPSRSLPSSLSFERGTISYVLVATLTRPTTISPTMFREKTVPFRETLDVGLQPKPKPRKLYLQALNRPRQQRIQPKRALTDRTRQSNSTNNQSSTDGSEHPGDEPPRSSTASEVSHESGLGSMILQTIPTPSRVTSNGDAILPTSSSGNGTISAQVDVLRGGFLPGDYVPIRISIKHTRSIKSMQGVIVTLYRKAKIDATPVIFGAKAPAFEDPVPRSITGLKGLSLTGRSSHLFRMDLAQAFAPMIINPASLEAEIKTAVRIPEDAFPTVACVPGQMIVFTYYVEVVMDLGGKLSNQDRWSSGLNMTNRAPNYSMGAKTSGSEHGLPSSMEIYHLIDTSEIKREKGVAQETIEIMVGSLDSKRKAGDIRKVNIWLDEDLASNFSNADEVNSERWIEEPPQSPIQSGGRSIDTVQQPILEPPQLAVSEYQEPQDEKARLRLAEQRLLPSAPPMDSENLACGSRPDVFVTASAPPHTDLDGYNEPVTAAVVPSLEELDPYPEDDIAPAYQREMGSAAGPSHRQAGRESVASEQTVIEDKAELERTRLAAMASSPDDHNDDEPEITGNQIDIPTAPSLDEPDLYANGDSDHALPLYVPRS